MWSCTVCPSYDVAKETFPNAPTKPFKRNEMSLGPDALLNLEDDTVDETIDSSAEVDNLKDFVDLSQKKDSNINDEF